MDAAKAAFESLPFGEVVACVQSESSGLVDLHFSTGGEDNVTAREALSKAAYEAGLGLVHLAVERASLEQAFAALTPSDADDIGPADEGDAVVPTDAAADNDKEAGDVA